ncbi:MAG: Para-hydroxybenzoate--polyprenyltransferase, mitochondrial precursor (PHB:polyprenyltransferase) [Phylliscum demangeonii]|nr:MAG: Para-hydroxybenzoate--polyprenyltransferase, mitochondrial precursor (PHB:polyprenyltransferase) [Phylliscum demangeonii]
MVMHPAPGLRIWATRTSPRSRLCFWCQHRRSSSGLGRSDERTSGDRLTGQVVQAGKHKKNDRMSNGFSFHHETSQLQNRNISTGSGPQLSPLSGVRVQQLSGARPAVGLLCPAESPAAAVPTGLMSSSVSHARRLKSGAAASASVVAGVAESSAVTSPSATASDGPPPYHPPSSGLLSYLPSSWVPYAELIRLDKPTGTYYLFFPCLFSTLLAAPLTAPMTAPADVMATSALFLAGALIMRGAGCTINDLWDRKFDAQVARTRLRPLARGAVTPSAAVWFTGVQLLAGLGILLQFPLPCLAYGLPSLLLVATYPLAKRVTYYPQAVLGLTFSWGAIMGFPALGLDLVTHPAALTAAGCLYASNVAWTMLYDIIYAHMDMRDDHQAGVKSMAVRYGAGGAKAILAGLALVQVSLLAAAGVAAGAGPAFFLAGCGTAALSLAVMIRLVRLQSVASCWWWFRYGCWFTGGAVAFGLGVDYLFRLTGQRERERELDQEPEEHALHKGARRPLPLVAAS